MNDGRQSEPFQLEWADAYRFSLHFGLTCFLAMHLDGRTQTGIETALKVAVIFYGGCMLFDRIDLEYRSMGIGFRKGLKYCALGAVISIPTAVLIVDFFILQEPSTTGILFSFGCVSFATRYSRRSCIPLLSIGLWLSSDAWQGFKTCFFIIPYILMVVPHSLIHLPDQTLVDPGGQWRCWFLPVYFLDSL